MEPLVITEWTPGNEESVLRHGASPDDCNRVIRALANDHEARIWLDRTGSKKEWYGVKRYVAVFRPAPIVGADTPTLLMGQYVRICFTVKDGGIPALFLEKVVRVLSIHPVREHDPLLRNVPPDRFILAPPLAELLRP